MLGGWAAGVEMELSARQHQRKVCWKGHGLWVVVNGVPSEASENSTAIYRWVTSALTVGETR